MENQKYNIVLKTMSRMASYLTTFQMFELQKVMLECLNEGNENGCIYTNDEFLFKFEHAKTVEGLSRLTTSKYVSSIQKLIQYSGNCNLTEITTETIRGMMVYMQEEKNWKATTLDTFRRQLSSFYEWMKEEEYMFSNPVRKIHKIKSEKRVKAVFSDEDIEKMRKTVKNERELAMVDLLVSSGMRVSELAGLNISDVDFNQRECIILGKGKKERVAYLDARAKVSLQEYLASREDDNEALFVSQHKPYGRISVRTIERNISDLGTRAGVGRSFPHRFRASMATKSLDKGMPIEHLQQIMGHASMDTTLHYYARVKCENVKFSHQKYIG